MFGGTLALNTFGEYGAPDTPEADKIMHGMLETDAGITLMAADTPPGMEPTGRQHRRQSQRRGLRRAPRLLGEAHCRGTVSVPLEKQMWGDEFGMCVDRFGIGWMVNITQPEG